MRAVIALASPSSRPSATPSMTPAPTPSITPVPATPTPSRRRTRPTPTPEPSPDTDAVPDRDADTDPIDIEDPDYYETTTIDESEPEIALLIGGIDGEAPLYIRTGDTVEEGAAAADVWPGSSRTARSPSRTSPTTPLATPWTVALEPLAEQSISMADGRHTFVATCGSEAGELTATVRAMAMDGKPEACRDFEFVRGEISVSSYEELTAGIIGTWKGCVTTPWTPMYEVTVTLREDGTYSAASDGGPRRQPR